MSLDSIAVYPDALDPDLGLTLESVPGVHERSFVGRTALYLVQKGLIHPSPYMGDIGCGKGDIGLLLATNEEVQQVLLTDKCETSLAVAHKNAAVNNLANKCQFSLDNTWGEEPRTIVANLPQNPNIEACGQDGSAIQRLVIEELTAQNLVALYVKDISYAATTVTQAYVTDRYRVERIARSYGRKPANVEGPEMAEAQYFRLTPKN